MKGRTPGVLVSVWDNVRGERRLQFVLSQEWLSGPPRARKTAVLRLETTPPFSARVCTMQLCVCKRSEMFACALARPAPVLLVGGGRLLAKAILKRVRAAQV